MCLPVVVAMKTTYGAERSESMQNVVPVKVFRGSGFGKNKEMKQSLDNCRNSPYILPDLE